MRIGFGAQLLSYPRASRSGVGTYVRELLAALPEWLDADSLQVFGGHPTPMPLRYRGVRVPYEQVALPVSARRAGVDVFHQPDATALLVRPADRMVVTVHDLTAFRHPGTLGSGRAAFKRSMLRRAVRQAAHVIAVSESTRADLTALLGVRTDQVSTVHCGVDPGWSRVDDGSVLAEARARLGLPERFVLTVGTLEPRKNLPRLIEAYAVARRQGLDIPLVVVGPPGWRSDDLQQAPAAHGVSDHVQFAGHLSRSDLRAVYSLAEVFVYPSLYEGFGLPVLEAMACGVPVVASSSSSLPEVAGDAAVLADPHDIGDLADALSRVAADGELRAALCRRGLERAAGFTWAAAARKTVDVYRAAERL